MKTEEGSAWCTCQRFLKEFTIEKLTWIHDQPRDFVESEWRFISPKLFTIYRVLLALGVLGWLIYDMVHESITHYIHMPAYWYLFATNWAFLLFVITNIYLAILCVIYNFRRERTDAVNGYGLAWLLYEISSTCVVVTSIVFWVDFTTLRDYALFKSESSQVKHSLNACLIAFDLLISAIPFRLVHIIYPFIMGIVYTIFNLVYWLANGPTPLKPWTEAKAVIYPEINWRNPGQTVGIIAIIFVICLLVHLLLLALYVLRHCLAVVACGRRDDELDETEAILKPSESGYSAIETRAPPKPTYEGD